MSEEKTASSGGKISVIAAILGNIGVAIVKFIASGISGSSAMFSEAIHSLVDCGNGALILVGLHRSKHPADFQHPFGFGKELYFYTFVVALAVFFLGGGVSIMEGLSRISQTLQGQGEIGDPLVAYVVLLLGACIEGSSLFVALRHFNRERDNVPPLKFIEQTKDPSNYTVVLEDSAAEMGLLFAFIGTVLTQLTQNALFDGVASILIGLLLCCVAVVLLRESKGLLVGEGVSSDEVDEIRDLACQDSNVLECGRVLTMYAGPDHLIVAMDVTLRPQLNASAVDLVTDGIERRVKDRWSEAVDVFIEVEQLGNVLAQHRAQDEWVDEDEDEDDED